MFNKKKIVNYYNKPSDILNAKKITKSYTSWLKAEEKKLNNLIPKTAKVLEIGAGTGRIIESLDNKLRKIFGIDITNIFYLKNKFKNNKNVKIFKMDAENLKFQDNSFDFCVIMYNTLGLMQHPEKVLQECKRVTKNNGFIILSTYEIDKKYTLNERIKCFSKLGHEVKNYELQLEISNGVASHYFTKKELLELFKKVKLNFICSPLTKLGCMWLSKVSK